MEHSLSRPCVVNVETEQWKTEIFKTLLVLTRKGSTYNEATDRCVASSTLLRNSGVHSLCEIIRKLQLYVNRPRYSCTMPPQHWSC